MILCYTNSVKNEELINSLKNEELINFLKNANFTTMISQIFHNFVFTGPICKILTFLETAFRFVCSLSYVRSAWHKKMELLQPSKLFYLLIIRLILTLLFEFFLERLLKSFYQQYCIFS